MRYLGVDLGRRRIGLALSDATGTLARPWRVVPSAASATAIVDLLGRIVADLVGEEEGLEGIVVGLPRRLDGSPTTETALAIEVAGALGTATALPVRLQDERLTSREAESRLALRDRSWQSRKARLDAASAAIILQDFLDEPGRTPAAGEPERSGA